MKQTVIFILLAMMLIGCQSGSQQSKIGELVEIDISNSYPKKEIHLQDVADIEYVALEITDDVLLSQSSRLSYISNNYIAFYDYRQGAIFVFNRNGTIASHFNHRGQGDKEYNYISSMIFDEKNGEIFIFDTPLPSIHRILVYSLSGEYKRTLNYADDLNITGYNFDDETMLVYDINGLMQNEEYSEKPYMFMSKKDGSIVSELDIRLPVRYSNRGRISITDESGRPTSAGFVITLTNNRFYGPDLVIADMSSDTIYRLTKNKELTPLIVRTPSVHSSEPRTIWATDLVTDKFIIFAKATLDFELVSRTQQVPMASFYYEFETGETSDVSFVNDDFPSGRSSPDGVDTPQKNLAVRVIQVFTLKEAYENQQLKGELEKLVSTLDEEDNPIVMIVKFK